MNVNDAVYRRDEGLVMGLRRLYESFGYKKFKMKKFEKYDLYLQRLIQGYARIVCSQEIMYAYENKISNQALFERLKLICENKLVADTLKVYPWHKLPKKQAAFAFAMKYRLYFLQKLMVLLRAR